MNCVLFSVPRPKSVPFTDLYKRHNCSNTEYTNYKMYKHYTNVKIELWDLYKENNKTLNCLNVFDLSLVFFELFYVLVLESVGFVGHAR